MYPQGYSQPKGERIGSSRQFLLKLCLEGCTLEGDWESGAAFLPCLVTFSGLSGHGLTGPKGDLSHFPEAS